MQALELMKTHVVKTTPDATLSEAVDLMDLYQVAGLPVVDTNGRLCGMITECDILRAMQGPLPQGDVEALAPSSMHRAGMLSENIEHTLTSQETASRRVGDWMTSPAIYVDEQSDVREAAQTLLLHGVKRLPVVDARGQVVGILNRIDICQAVFEGNT